MDYQGMNKFTKTITFIPEDTLMKDSKKEGEEAEEAKSATLEMLILQVIKMAQEIDLEPSTYINFLTLIRKVIPNQQLISEKQFLIDELVEMSKEKVSIFDGKIQGFIKSNGE